MKHPTCFLNRRERPIQRLRRREQRRIRRLIERDARITAQSMNPLAAPQPWKPHTFWLELRERFGW